MKLERKDVYVPVSVDTEQPPIKTNVFAINVNNNWANKCRIGVQTKIKTNEKKFYWENATNDYIDQNYPSECFPTHWLKKETLYTFTEEELKNLLKQTHENGEGLFDFDNYFENILKQD
jgi:hypothetical protein